MLSVGASAVESDLEFIALMVQLLGAPLLVMVLIGILYIKGYR